MADVVSKDEQPQVSKNAPTAADGSRPTPLRTTGIKSSSQRSFDSPLRHHARTNTTPRRIIKETLNARSEYTNSQDDGTAEHRINQYLIKQEIGRGSFGAVHLAADQYGQEYAVKEFSKSRLRKRAQSHVLRHNSGARRHGVQVGFNSPLHRHPSGHEDEPGGNSLWLIKEEIAIMKKLHHTNLVSLIEVLDDPTEDSLYMVMEMCKKGVIMKVGLGEDTDPYDDDRCRCWFRDLILGIEYLHAQGIVHRDIKPDNCLLTSDDVLKIVDFGVSEMFEKDSDMYTAKSAGSPAFLPPELCVVKHGDVSGRAADIWSMGVTLYCLRYGRIPFEKESIFELYDSIRNDEVKCEGETDEDFKDLIFRILEKDPTKRITMSELREHSWVTKRGADSLLSAEENTANLVGPPTEEEMNMAITSNMSHALTVVKAVQKFKRLIEPASPRNIRSILGEDVPSHFVQPPLAIDESYASRYEQRSTKRKTGVDGSSSSGGTATVAIADAVTSKSQVTDWNRQSGANSGEVNLTNQKGSETSQISNPHTAPSRAGSQSSIAGTKRPCTTPPQISRAGTPSRSTCEGTRGHARDPLEEEHLYLSIGPSTFSGSIQDTSAEVSDKPWIEADGADDNPAISSSDAQIVSESPGATDVDIYEIAYNEEIERIRSRSRELRAPTPRVYLTRRMEGGGSALTAMFQQSKQGGASSRSSSRFAAAARRGLESVRGDPAKPRLASVASSIRQASFPAPSTDTPGEGEPQSASLGLQSRVTTQTVSTGESTPTTATGIVSPVADNKSRSDLRDLLNRIKENS